jgi:hypothetical protein
MVERHGVFIRLSVLAGRAGERPFQCSGRPTELAKRSTYRTGVLPQKWIRVLLVPATSAFGVVYAVYTMKRKQIYIEEEQERAIKAIAERRRVPEALVIREALAEYVTDHEMPVIARPEDHPLWGIVGIGKAGVTDGSVNHDYYLYGAPKVEP